ncbi:MAG: transglycosylase SLT domain-containing protein [Acidobacteriota bacterium]
MNGISLTIHYPNGRTEQLPLNSERLTIGQNNADLLIEDAGLTNHRASIYRDGSRVWILDEDIYSCSYVNGAPVPREGRILNSGDKITIGDYTTIWVNIAQAAKQRSSQNQDGKRSAFAWLSVIPILVFIVLAGVIGSKLIGKTDSENSNHRTDNPNIFQDDNSNRSSDLTVNKNSKPPTGNDVSNTSPTDVVIPPPTDDISTKNLPVKRYLQLSDSERLTFVKVEAKRISGVIGNRPCEFTDEVMLMIKNFVDGYAKRAGNSSARLWSEDTQSIYSRASKFAPMIIRAFNKESVNPIVGLYIPMIETEYRNNLTSPANCKGMFQFMPSTAAAYGVHGEEIWDVEKTAPAAAKYMKDRLSEFGGDATGVALAIAGYNRSPDSVRRDLHTVFNASTPEERDRSFWTLIAKREILDKWFKGENKNYPPKFYAAAIVGENPKIFNIPLNKPLSTYTD